MTTKSAEFEALLDLSARVGADPLLVQAAGGNTSLKEDGILWIKASGLWLAHARDRDIMVPVRLAPLLEALERGDPAAETARDFVVADHNPSGLRPSIETTVHAVLPHKVVVHVHCVETIAAAALADGEAVVAARLGDIPHLWLPYIRPGLPLARAIAAARRPEADVLVLGNHGLVVAAETVAEAAALLSKVCRRLAFPVRASPAPDKAALHRLAEGSDYMLPEDDRLHASATDPDNCRIAAGGSLYPDHVIFLGRGATVALSGETAAGLEARFAREGLVAPPILLFSGTGVLVRKDINAGALALAHCLSEVTSRIPPDAGLHYLTDAQNAELLGWDAEKYRQALNR